MTRRRKPVQRAEMIDVVRELLLGARVTRHTVMRMGVSSATADRWLTTIERKIPKVFKVRDGNTSLYEWRGRLSVQTPTEFYVDPVRGDDRNAGMKESPFKTFAKLNAVLQRTTFFPAGLVINLPSVQVPAKRGRRLRRG